MLFPFLVDFHLRILSLVLANVKELYKNYLRLKPRFDTNLEPHIKHSYKKNQCTHDKTGECTLRWPFHLIKTSFDKKCRVNTNSGNLVELLQYRISGGDKTIENHLQMPHEYPTNYWVLWIMGGVTCAIFLALMTIVAEILIYKNDIHEW